MHEGKDGKPCKKGSTEDGPDNSTGDPGATKGARGRGRIVNAVEAACCAASIAARVLAGRQKGAVGA